MLIHPIEYSKPAAILSRLDIIACPPCCTTHSNRPLLPPPLGPRNIAEESAEFVCAANASLNALGGHACRP